MIITKLNVVHLLTKFLAQYFINNLWIGLALGLPHDLADALGLSSVYVSQTLKQLREQRVLIFRNGRLQILSPVALAELADFDSSLVA